MAVQPSLEEDWIVVDKPKPALVHFDELITFCEELPIFTTATGALHTRLSSKQATHHPKTGVDESKAVKKADKADKWKSKQAAKQAAQAKNALNYADVGGKDDTTVYADDSNDGTDGYKTDLKGVKNEMTEKVLSEIAERQLRSARLIRAPSDYYQRSLEYRRDCLGAPHINYLCKSLLMKNTKAGGAITDCSDPYNSLYYLVIFQYTTKLNSEKIMKYVRKLNEFKVSKKHFKFRLAPAEESQQLTGFKYNAVSPIGSLNPDIPIILSHRLLELPHFWMGGGEVDVKFAMGTNEFRNKFRPFVGDIVYDGFIDPNENLEH